MKGQKDKPITRSKLHCMRHPDRPAAIVCNNNRAFCQECMDLTDLRCGYCGYCPDKVGCPIQRMYYMASGD